MAAGAAAGSRGVWGAVAIGGLALAFVAAGVRTRRRKAVHLFEEGIVLVGMWGQVKAVGRWSGLTVWIKRTTSPRPRIRPTPLPTPSPRC